MVRSCLLCECANDLGRDVEEEDGPNERKRQDENDKWISGMQGISTSTHQKTTNSRRTLGVQENRLCKV